MRDIRSTIIAWLIGMASSIGSIGITLSGVEAAIRIIASLGGVVITGLTVVKLLREFRRARRSHHRWRG